MPHYKTIFISDIHLGSRASQAEMLVDFLKNNTCEKLFLVGDIIDGWRLRRRWYFPQSHANVIRAILGAAKRGTEVYYVLGNHDEVFRKFLNYNINVGRINICDHVTYIAVNGKQYYVTHGDAFDSLMSNGKWLMHVGDTLYAIAVWANMHFNWVRKKLRLPYWSLSNWLKTNTKQAVAYIDNYEEHVANYCEKQGFAGIICGHIHTPAIKQIKNVTYMNCGDWCESCTALVETLEGDWQLLFITDTKTS